MSKDSFFAEFSVINYLPCAAGFCTEERVFDFPYLLYVHGGTGKYKIGSRVYSCQKGDLLFCPAGVGNTIMADEKEPYILSGIDFTVNDNEYINQRLAAVVNLTGYSFAQECIGKMIEAHLYSEQYSREICTYTLNAFLSELFRLQSDGKTKRNDEKSKEIIAYIERNSERNITYEELARVFHYHRNTIAYIVRQATGMTVKEYIIAARMKTVQQNLLFTQDRVEEIAARTGYSSTAYFCLQFKQKFGETPTQFRKRCRVL